MKDSIKQLNKKYNTTFKKVEDVDLDLWVDAQQYVYVCFNNNEFIKDYIGTLNLIKTVISLGKTPKTGDTIVQKVLKDKVRDYEILEETVSYIVYNDTSDLKGV